MAQVTRVVKVDAATAKQLYEQLQVDLLDAEWRSAPHARFALKAAGLVVTCYNSGKLVVQGNDPDMFLQRYLSESQAAAPAGKTAGKSTTKSGRNPDPVAVAGPMMGSDETGKGDYFGPLVVAAAFAGAEQLEALRQAGVMDSKKVTDDRAMMLAGLVERHADVEVAVLMPADYNPRYQKVGNLNEMLADLHAQVLVPLLERHGVEVPVVVDKFARESLITTRLRRAGQVPSSLTCVPRAESYAVVAAASLVARARFLEGTAKCSELCGVDLHKGAGAPVDRVARKVYAVGGRDLLAQVAKLHFRNTDRVR